MIHKIGTAMAMNPDDAFTSLDTRNAYGTASRVDAVTQATNHIARVELGGHLTRGMMVLDKRPEPVTAGQRKNVTIIEKIDRAKLQHRLLEAFSLNSWFSVL